MNRLRSARVLFVEGDGALNAVADALGGLGVQVLRVDHTELAVEALRLTRIDAVVLSYGVAGERGTGLMRELSGANIIDPRRIVLLPATLASEPGEDSEPTREAVAAVLRAVGEP